MIAVYRLRFHLRVGRMPAAAALCLACAGTLPPLAAQVVQPGAEAANSDANQENTEILQLVADLGADDYGTREAASERLIQLGAVVAPYVRQAAESPNLEVNTRAERILAIVSRQSFEEAIEAFLADEDGRLGTALPGWERARDRLGDTPEGRRLFAEVYRAEPALLASYGEGGAAQLSSFSIRVDELYDQHTQQNQINYQLQNQLRHAASGNILALLFVGADPSLDLSPMSVTKFKMLFTQTWPAERVASAAQRDHLREWLAEWIVLRFNQPQREHEGIMLGMTYDIPRTVDLALSVLRRRQNESYMLMYAALCVGKYGRDWHLPLLEPLLANETVVQQRQRQIANQLVQYQIQLRDVVLLILIERTHQAAEDYGFAEVDRHAEFLFLPHTVAFERVEDRDKAFARWQAWRRAHNIFDGEPPSPHEQPQPSVAEE